MARRYWSIAALVAIVVGSSPVAAAPISGLRDGQMIVQLPPDWRRIDQQELDIVALWGAEVTGGRVGELWEAGFAPGGRDLELGPPFVLVQIDESGRVSYAEVALLPELEALQSRVDAHRDEGLGQHTVPLRLESVGFDRDRFALTTVSRLVRSPWGPLVIHTVTYLTETGSITLHGYLGEASEDTDRRAVGAILGDLLIADDLAYRPRVLDRWLDVSRRPGFWYTLAGLMTIATILVVWRTRLGVRDRKPQ